MNPENRDARIRLAVLCLIFLCSGAAALLFETLWFRGAGLTFGNSVWASSITLAAYMAGLAFGNYLAGRIGSLARRPVLTYAVLELLIAGTGLLLVALFPVLPSALAPKLGLMDEGLALGVLPRLSAVFLLLMVPTTAMGATLPLLVKALCDTHTGFGKALGYLYGWNTLGALLGVLAGEFVLIERFGLLGTGVVAALLDVLAAALALLVAKRLFQTDTLEPHAHWKASRNVRLLLVAGALAGCALMGAEVLWFRFLRLFFLDTEATFVVMLAVVLAGIGLGGLLAGELINRGRNIHSMAVVAAGACGLALIGSYALFDARILGAGWYIELTSIASLSAVLMFPTALASGALFTLLGQAVHAETGSTTQATAALTMANTIGAMSGALLAGFLLLPAMGVEKAWWVLAFIYCAVMLCLLLALRFDARPALRTLQLGSAVLLAAALLLFPFGRMHSHLELASEKFRSADGSHTVAVSEGMTETLQYLRRDFQGVPVSYSLLTNGFSMTDSQPGSRRYMGMYAHWANAVHPAMESALLISYGMGNTAKSLTQIPTLRSIHVVDISENILAHAGVPYPGAENPLADPRIKVVVDDGRYYLEASNQHYDLITSEPPPPRASGVISLYTEEYFRLIRSRLNAGGLATYWLPVHNMTAPDALAILKGFCNAFPDCGLWGGYGKNWMMTGSRDARPTTGERFSAPWRGSALRAALAEIGLERQEMLGASFMADSAQLKAALENVAPLTDNYPKRYSQAVPGEADYRFYASWMDVRKTRRHFIESAWVDKFWPAEVRTATVDFFHVHPAVNDLEDLAAKGLRLQMLAEVLKIPGLQTPVLWLLGTQHREVEVARKGADRNNGNAPPADIRYILGAGALAQGDLALAADHFEQALDADDKRALAPFLFAACRMGQAERAQRIAGLHSTDPIRNSLARCW